MQIVFRCKFCHQMTVNDDPKDLCLEIDAFEQEIRFICRKCKKENKIKLSAGSSKRSDEVEPLPRIAISRY